MARRIFHMLIDAIIPPICPLCNRGVTAPGLCAVCFAKLHLLAPALLYPLRAAF